ncbi:unnamed protein product [Euphydryas editha]|uniref:Uncharacterized protein n=1 Tax=Euphydryas editha TaxID=104508 RepID=A0AAU9TPN7_EUPED|nr:unnamed protein product [Euphydryas editha]
MADNMTSDKLLAVLNLENTEQVSAEFQLAGTQPSSVASTEIRRTLTIVGLTPDDFTNTYSSVEFDFNALKDTFKLYCKDFEEPLVDQKPSKALEFSAKMPF